MSPRVCRWLDRYPPLWEAAVQAISNEIASTARSYGEDGDAGAGRAGD